MPIPLAVAPSAPDSGSGRTVARVLVIIAIVIVGSVAAGYGFSKYQEKKKLTLEKKLNRQINFTA